jgi:hypothetical protein
MHNFSNTRYEADLEADETRVVTGVRGMASRPFSRRFRNADAMDRWLESEAAGDYEIHSIERA